MTKRIKKSTILAGLLASSMLIAGGAALASPVQAYADTETEVVTPVAFGNVFSATIRVSDPNGLRFMLELSDAKKAEIFGENSNKKLGMFIISADQVEAANGNYAAVEKKVEIEFTESDLYQVDGMWRANGVLADLYLQNFTREFIGIGYVATVDGDDVTYDEYSTFTVEDNARSMFDVAFEVYNDPECVESQSIVYPFVEKAFYAAAGVVESRTEADDTVTYTFTKGDNIWSTYAEMVADCPITMSVAQTEATLSVGDTLDLGAALTIDNTKITTLDLPFTYSVDVDDVVTLEDGVLTAVLAGAAEITVSYEDYSATVTVNVANPADVILNTNSVGVLKSVKTAAGEGTHEVAYSKDVKMGEDKGSLQVTCLTDGTGYLQITNPLITNVSAYDYFEFQVYNPTDHIVRMSVTWVDASVITIQAGETGTMKILASYFGSGGICTPSGDVMLATDITNIRFYVRDLVVGESVYFSSFKAFKNDVVVAENVIVNANAENSVNCFALYNTNLKIGGTHSLTYTNEIKYGEEQGSLKLTLNGSAPTTDGNGYYVGYMAITAPLLKDISAYNYIQFNIYNPNDTLVKISLPWVKAFDVSPNSWTTVQWTLEELKQVADPLELGTATVTDITNLPFYVMRMQKGESIYISSIVAGKNA